MAGERVKLRIRDSIPSEETIANRKRGDILHRALSLVRDLNDRERVGTLVKRAIILEGERPEAWNAEELRGELEAVLEAEWAEKVFPNQGESLKEQAILLPEEPGVTGVTVRPDRMVRLEGKVMVVDYKSKRPSSEEVLQRYKEQVRRYLEAAKEALGAEEAEGYLLFIADNVLEKVEE